MDRLWRAGSGGSFERWLTGRDDDQGTEAPTGEYRTGESLGGWCYTMFVYGMLI